MTLAKRTVQFWTNIQFVHAKRKCAMSHEDSTAPFLHKNLKSRNFLGFFSKDCKSSSFWSENWNDRLLARRKPVYRAAWSRFCFNVSDVKHREWIFTLITYTWPLSYHSMATEQCTHETESNGIMSLFLVVASVVHANGRVVVAAVSIVRWASVTWGTLVSVQKEHWRNQNNHIIIHNNYYFVPWRTRSNLNRYHPNTQWQYKTRFPHRNHPKVNLF